MTHHRLQKIPFPPLPWCVSYVNTCKPLFSRVQKKKKVPINVKLQSHFFYYSTATSYIICGDEGNLNFFHAISSHLFLCHLMTFQGKISTTVFVANFMNFNFGYDKFVCLNAYLMSYMRKTTRDRFESIFERVAEGWGSGTYW